jgi:hypothetical protein
MENPNSKNGSSLVWLELLFRTDFILHLNFFHTNFYPSLNYILSEAPPCTT